MGNLPVKKNKPTFCFGYPNDLDHAYAFYCARYENITFKEFLKLGLTDFLKKFQSIPESEPLFTIIKSRTIDLGTIKDKNEKKYWTRLKKINEIPSEYLSVEEIISDLSNFTKENKLWFKKD